MCLESTRPGLPPVGPPQAVRSGTRGLISLSVKLGSTTPNLGGSSWGPLSPRSEHRVIAGPPALSSQKNKWSKGAPSPCTPAAPGPPPQCSWPSLVRPTPGMPHSTLPTALTLYQPDSTAASAQGGRGRVAALPEAAGTGIQRSQAPECWQPAWWPRLKSGEEAPTVALGPGARRGKRLGHEGSR